jgi:cytidylate kinase
MFQIPGFVVGRHDLPTSYLFLNGTGTRCTNSRIAEALTFEMMSAGVEFRTPNNRFRCSVATMVSVVIHLNEFIYYSDMYIYHNIKHKKHLNIVPSPN